MIITLTIELEAPDNEPAPADLARFAASQLYLEFGDSQPGKHDGHADELATRQQWMIAKASCTAHYDDDGEEIRRCGRDD